ncbi:winged helix-turn-helix transcriptional regulator [Nocardiopsis sp. NPDC006198]|uniref:winged helix-turn-helix transcriptional regulator n=1 Tax=Nocardiopsis sp. NPDC006198 TaxID=3154472 RepID=UPI0033BF0A56
MRKDDTVEALREAVKLRQEHDEGAAKARKDIDRLVLELLQQDPTRDREELAEIAGLSDRTVRAIAKAGGIPPLKPGGVGRRVTKG